MQVEHSNPAGYHVTKPMDYPTDQDQQISTFYQHDYTGRGAITSRVNELLHKARRVIQAEEDKVNGVTRKKKKKNTTGFGATSFSKGSLNTTNQFDDPMIAANRIGPFSFEVDPMIESEVLTEAVVKEDLHELDEILPQQENNMNTKFMGKSKRKK